MIGCEEFKRVEPLWQRAKDICELEKCVDFHGLERGGHHAVMNWLLGAMEKDVKCRVRLHLSHTNEPLYLWSHRGGWFRSAGKDPKAAALTYLPDQDLSDAPSRIDHRKVVVAVRDVRNLLASRLKWNRQNRELFDVNVEAVNRWEMYARQVLGDVDYFGGNAVGMVFDRWFVDEGYRCDKLEEMGSKWGVVFEGDGEAERKKVLRAAGGSSFDGRKYSGDAQNMKVLCRWKEFEGDEDLCRLLTDDVLKLNDRLLEEI